MRMGFFCIGLGLFAALEWLEPRFVPRQPRRVRWTANLGFAIGNGLLVRLGIGALFLGWVDWVERQQYGLMGLVGVPMWQKIVGTIVILDFSFYVFHRYCMHVWPFGWRFHKVHHTDLELDVTSASRFHLGELLLSMVYTAAVVALFGPPLGGVVIYEGAKLFAAQFNHSNWYLPRRFEHVFGWLFVTPAIHWVHHSVIPAETHSNFANIFSCWDRLFRTYRGEADAQKITLGLPAYRDGAALKIGDIFVLPFRREPK